MKWAKNVRDDVYEFYWWAHYLIIYVADPDFYPTKLQVEEVIYLLSRYGLIGIDYPMASEREKIVEHLQRGTLAEDLAIVRRVFAIELECYSCESSIRIPFTLGQLGRLFETTPRAMLHEYGDYYRETELPCPQCGKLDVENIVFVPTKTKLEELLSESELTQVKEARSAHQRLFNALRRYGLEIGTVVAWLRIEETNWEASDISLNLGWLKVLAQGPWSYERPRIKTHFIIFTEEGQEESFYDHFRKSHAMVIKDLEWLLERIVEVGQRFDDAKDFHRHPEWQDWLESPFK